MVDDMPNGIGIDVLRRHLDQLSIQFSSLIRLHHKVIVVVFKRYSRVWHWVWQLLLVVKPPAIIAEKVGAQGAGFCCLW